MSLVNSAFVLGNLGQDPELKYTPGGMAVCKLNVATTERSKDKDGNSKEEVEWHNVVTWGKTAENCAKFLTKGNKVAVRGKLKTRSWEDKTTGKKSYATEINAEEVQFLTPKTESRPAPQQQYAGQGLDEIPF